MKEQELSGREATILLALAGKELSGYGIVRQCHEDTAGDLRLSNGTVFPALGRLEKLGAIEPVTSKADRLTRSSARVYRLTRLGRQLLELQLAAFRRMVRLGGERI